MTDDDVAPAPTTPARGPRSTWLSLVAGEVPRGVEDIRAAELVERYGPLVRAGERAVVAQLAQSLDGFIAARSGDPVFVAGPEDRAHVHRLRALVDAVVVGVGTVVADDCRLTVREVEGPHPVRVVLDTGARAPLTAALMRDGEAPVLWCVAADRPAPRPPAAHVSVLALPAAGRRFAPGVVLAALAARGLGRVLVEGGGRTVSDFLAAGVLDRLYLTTAPLLIGDGVPGLRFTGTDRVADALRAPVRRWAHGVDLCTELDLAAVRGEATIASADGVLTGAAGSAPGWGAGAGRRSPAVDVRELDLRTAGAGVATASVPEICC